MSGHSKWHRIKHKKAATDAKRGKVFGHLSRAIRLAAREGTDLTTNATLREAVDRARRSSLPQVNIDRLLQQGAGELIDIMYEGYGPGGIAMLIAAATNNTNRTVSEIRSIMKSHSGRLAERGSVAWKFKQQAIITTEVKLGDRDKLELAAITAGALDTFVVAKLLTIIGPPHLSAQLSAALAAAGARDVQASVTYYVPNNVRVSVAKTEQTIFAELTNELYAHADVLAVYTDAQEN